MKTRNTIFAAPIAVPASVVKPNNAAIRAMIRNSTAKRIMIGASVGYARESAARSPAGPGPTRPRVAGGATWDSPANVPARGEARPIVPALARQEEEAHGVPVAAAGPHRRGVSSPVAFPRPLLN